MVPFIKVMLEISSVVYPDLVGSALFGRIWIRIVMEKTEPGSTKGSQNKGQKVCLFIFLLDL